MANGKLDTKTLIGAAVGAGGSTAASMILRQTLSKKPKYLEWSEAMGAGVGLLGGAAMVFLGKKKGWKQAGYVAMASAVLSNGLRQLEYMAFKKTVLEGWSMILLKEANAAIPSATPDSGGMGLVDIERTTALKDAVVDPTTVLQGSDLPQLVGANLESANAHVQLVGAPPLAEHSGHWGSTLFAR